MVLGVIMLLVHQEVTVWSVVLAATAILIKGMLIPTLLQRAMREVAIRREVEPLVGFVSSLLLGAVATGAAIAFSGTLPLAPGSEGSLAVPSSLATVLTGFLILTTRKKAITQVVGYLVLENGIFIMGLLLSEAVPVLVELGVLLDLLVAIFVLGIMIHHINRAFASLDTSRLSTLKE
jgi:hydrogenase-4 component E